MTASIGLSCFGFLEMCVFLKIKPLTKPISDSHGTVPNRSIVEGGGYYLHLSPGNNFLACGFWDPNPADLKRIRQEIDIDGGEYRSILHNKTFKSVWGEPQGEAVKTAPKGYAKDHPDIDLLRLKQHIFTIKYDDDIVGQPDFLDRADKALQAVRPFVDYMSEVLTTNADGESLV